MLLVTLLYKSNIISNMLPQTKLLFLFKIVKSNTEISNMFFLFVTINTSIYVTSLFFKTKILSIADSRASLNRPNAIKKLLSDLSHPDLFAA